MADKFDDRAIVSLTSLLQDPAIVAACTDNCGCNEACGCKKDNCCEQKCGCDGKSPKRVLRAEELIKYPQFLDVVREFDADEIKTVQNFEALVAKMRERIR